MSVDTFLVAVAVLGAVISVGGALTAVRRRFQYDAAQERNKTDEQE